MNILRASLGAVAIAAAALASNTAFADTYSFQTATFTGVEAGDYYIDSTRYIGAAFTLTQATDIYSIGGYFSAYSDGGTLFGAIVPLSSLTSTPTTAITSNALAHVVFTPTGTDETEALSVHLAAGTYAVVFGSGLYNTNGYSGLVNNQDGSGAHLFSGTGSSFSNFTDTDVRITVNGTIAAVPEPESWALMLAGLAGVGAVLRRRKA